MSEKTKVLHVARPGGCNVQQTGQGKPRTGAGAIVTMSLKAASIQILERNRACYKPPSEPQENRATSRCNTTLLAAAVVASDRELCAELAEFNGLVARIARYGRLNKCQDVPTGRNDD